MDSLDFSRKFRERQAKKNGGADKEEPEVANVHSEYFEEGDDLDLDFEIVSSDEEDGNFIFGLM